MRIDLSIDEIEAIASLFPGGVMLDIKISFK